jgi:hypothetical protein
MEFHSYLLAFGGTQWHFGKKIERVSRSLQGGKCVFCTWYTFKPLTFQKSPC